MQGELWITGVLGGLPIFNGGMAHTIENGQASSLKLGEMRTAGDLKEPLPRSHLEYYLFPTIFSASRRRSLLFTTLCGTLRRASRASFCE